MSTATAGIIDAVVWLLEDETVELKAGRFSRIAETTERKSRLMLQLSNEVFGHPLSENLTDKLEGLRKALRSNLRVSRENLESLRELIELQLDVEQELENDGTYAISGR
jgi:hypothetical protein